MNKDTCSFLNNTFFVVVAFSLRSRASGDTALSYVCCVHACMSVGVHRGHVRWDAWWWIRAGTNVLVHLWNENQGKGDRRRRAPSHSHQASCRHNLTLFDDLMANTQTKAYFFALYIFPLSFFLPLRKPAQNRSDRRTIHRLAWSARHVWPHCQKRRPWMRWADTQKNQAQPIPLLGYFQSASKKQYRITAVPFTVTWLTFSYLFFVLSLSQVKYFVL